MHQILMFILTACISGSQVAMIFASQDGQCWQASGAIKPRGMLNSGGKDPTVSSTASQSKVRCSLKRQCCRVWWHTPLTPRTQEAEAGRVL